MTMGNNKTTIVVALHLLFIFTLVLSTTASMKARKGLIPHRAAAPPAAPAKVSCNKVYGVEGGDTCSSVAIKFELNEGQFFGINPNVSCNTLFIGQWLCLSGTA